MFGKNKDWRKKLQQKIINRQHKKVQQELENLRSDIITLGASVESLANYAYFDDDPYAQDTLMNLEQELEDIIAAYRVVLKKVF